MLSITPEDPEYYSELLENTSIEAKQRPFRPSTSPIHKVDDPDDRRLQTLLDALAGISVSEQGNVAATMASVKDDGGVLDTTLYIVFNRQRDRQATEDCRRHLYNIFKILRDVPYKTLATEEFENHLIALSKAIHEYSLNIFEHRVLEWAKELAEIRKHIQADEEHFKPEERATMMTFLMHVEAIIGIVDTAHDMREISPTNILVISAIYTFWTKNDLLPDDLDEKLTLLDNADRWLAEEYQIGFQLRRWAAKIMSFTVFANRLSRLSQSRRLHNILRGNFSVIVLDSPVTTPYECDLSRRTIEQALNVALHGTDSSSADLDEEGQLFVTWLEKGLKNTTVERNEPVVHAELALIMAMESGELGDVLPYIGVSKPSCIMCNRYVEVYNEVTKQKIATRGSHEEVYSGWSWPSLPRRDGDLRQAFLQSIRQQLLEDFGQYRMNRHRKSDSIVGSEPGGGGLARKRTVVEIGELISKGRADALRA